MTKRKFLGEFEQVVLLAVLRLDGDGYGMSVRREIEDRTERSVSIGAVYATLERLEEKGFLASRTGPSSSGRGGRPRRYFAASHAGRDALGRSRDMLDSLWDGVELADDDATGEEVA